MRKFLLWSCVRGRYMLFQKHADGDMVSIAAPPWNEGFHTPFSVYNAIHAAQLELGPSSVRVEARVEGYHPELRRVLDVLDDRNLGHCVACHHPNHHTSGHLRDGSRVLYVGCINQRCAAADAATAALAWEQSLTVAAQAAM
jgi:hypothetical protein